MTTSVTHGPSLRVPFAAVIVEFDLPAETSAHIADSIRRVESALPPGGLAQLQAPTHPDNPVQGILQVAQAFTEARGRMDLPATCGAAGTRGWIALGYHDALATQHAMRTAVTTFRAALDGANDKTIKSLINTTLELQRGRQPSSTTRALMRVAREHAVPVYAIAADSNIWQYGQGRKAWHFHTASTHADATTGVMLQQNKAQSNALVRRLGLPGVDHGVATSAQQALTLARQLGFPLVVKPLDSGQGYGVTANIQDVQGVSAAYARAVRYSRSRRVIVERHVAGDDFRLMVTGGRFQWAIRRRPPEVTGDGASTIAELMARANAAVSPDRIEQGYAKPVAVDDEVRRTLAAAGRALDDKLPVGDVVRLRSNANVSTGGSFIDVSDTIHPDNRRMAETIARAFRLDSVGIDFLTPDIARSWQIVRCAVIEVNATPMLFSDEHARRLLDNKFPDGGNGRLPSLLVLADNPAQMQQLYGTWNQPGRGVGIATPTRARLDGLERRFAAVGNAHRAVTSLLLDPACNALLILSTFDGIRRHGLPLDRCSAAAWLTASGPDAEIRALLDSACDQTMRITANAILETLQKLR